ncbi:MAG: T9SS type A sorting domain-containing protein [Flavobacteriales bacterium]|nr:MAG: T9SS type A sorting domain-containing protein [Flavobacteriales bacterium]
MTMKRYVLNTGVCNGITKGLLPTADSGAIVWGRYYGPFALRVDGTLDPVWSKRLMDAGAFSFFKELPNGDLLAGINMQTAGVVVARMNAAGEVLWSRSYIRPRGVVSDAIIEPDGSFVLVGYTDSTGTTDPIFTPLPPGYNPKLFMMKLNGEGDVLWCKGYRSTTNLWYTRRDAVIERTLDGQYAVLATLGPPNQHDWFRPYLMKTDLNGDTLWTRSVGRNNYTYVTQDLQASSDGGYMISGLIYGDMPGPYSGMSFIYKADSLGYFNCWQRVPSIEIMDLFPVDSTVVLNIISGIATATPMAFTDSILDSSMVPSYDGCTFTTGMPLTMPRSRSISVRPNPTPGRITVEFPDPLLRDSYYSVYDAMGKLLFQRSLPKGHETEEVDLTCFGAGTYVIRFTDQEGSCYERVVVE